MLFWVKLNARLLITYYVHHLRERDKKKRKPNVHKEK